MTGRAALRVTGGAILALAKGEPVSCVGQLLPADARLVGAEVTRAGGLRLIVESQAFDPALVPPLLPEPLVVKARRPVAIHAVRMRAQRGTIERRMAPVLRTFFRAQGERVADRLRAARKSTRLVERKDLAADLVPPEDDAALRDVALPYEEAAVRMALREASAVLGQPEPDAAAYLQDELAQAGERIVGINDVTREAVAELLQEADARGYSEYQIANGVPDEDFPALADYVAELYQGRAETIARTEMAYATQHAALADWRDAGIEEQEIEDGEDFDEECAARNGTRVGIDEDADPLHPNCTVVSYPVIPEDF